MDKEVEARLKRLEALEFRDLIKHKHCIDCGVEIAAISYSYSIPCFPYEGRLINNKPHCNQCAALHDPPPPRADHTHKETKPKKDK